MRLMTILPSVLDTLKVQLLEFNQVCLPLTEKDGVEYMSTSKQALELPRRLNWRGKSHAHKKWCPIYIARDEDYRVAC